MELDLSKLDIDSLTSGERKFDDLIVSSIFAANGVGYVADQVTLA